MFLQTIPCDVLICSTAQLVLFTLNSAANEPRFTILKERLNVLGMGPLLALASAGLLSHTAPVCGPRSCLHQLQSSPPIPVCLLQPRPLLLVVLLLYGDHMLYGEALHPQRVCTAVQYHHHLITLTEHLVLVPSLLEHPVNANYGPKRSR